MIDKKTTGECIIIQLASWLITSDARCAHELNPGLPWQKQGSPKRRLFPPENLT